MAKAIAFKAGIDQSQDIWIQLLTFLYFMDVGIQGFWYGPISELNTHCQTSQSIENML